MKLKSYLIGLGVLLCCSSSSYAQGVAAPKLDAYIEQFASNAGISLEIGGGYSDGGILDASIIYGEGIGSYLYWGVGFSAIANIYEGTYGWGKNSETEIYCDWVLPVFLDFQINLSKKESHPFLEYRAGYDLCNLTFYHQPGFGYMFKPIGNSSHRFYIGGYYGSSYDMYCFVMLKVGFRF